MFNQVVSKFRDNSRQYRPPHIFDSDFLHEFKELAMELFRAELHSKALSYRAGVIQKAL